MMNKIDYLVAACKAEAGRLVWRIAVFNVAIFKQRVSRLSNTT
ncbi:hypothetical protein N5V81_13990 [Escherichia coli]|nr:hypothetical protein [Escherichia coli]